MLAFSCTWSFGANLEKNSRINFSKGIKQEMNQLTGNLLREFLISYDFYYDFTSFQPKNWKNILKETDFSSFDLNNEMLI